MPESQATPPRVNPSGGSQPPPRDSGPGFATPQGGGYGYPPQQPQGYPPHQGQPTGYPSQGHPHQLSPEQVYAQYSGQGQGPGGPPIAAGGDGEEPPRRRGGIWVALAIVVVVALGAGLAFYFSDGWSAATPSASPTPAVTTAAPRTPSPEPSTPEPEPSTPAPEPSTPAPEPSTPEPSTPAPDPHTSDHVVVGDILPGEVCQIEVTDAIGEVDGDGYVTSGAGLRFEAIPGWETMALSYLGIHQSNSQMVSVIPGVWMGSVTVGVLEESAGFSADEADLAALRLINCIVGADIFGDDPGDAEVTFAEFNDEGVFFLDVQIDINGIEGVNYDILEVVTVPYEGQMHVALAVIPDTDGEVIDQAQAAIRNLTWR